jgi:hypothetical protein
LLKNNCLNQKGVHRATAMYALSVLAGYSFS